MDTFGLVLNEEVLKGGARMAAPDGIVVLRCRPFSTTCLDDLEVQNRGAHGPALCRAQVTNHSPGFLLRIDKQRSRFATHPSGSQHFAGQSPPLG